MQMNLILKLSRIIQRENWFNKSIDKETEKNYILLQISTFQINQGIKAKVKKRLWDYEIIFPRFKYKILGQGRKFPYKIEQNFGYEN